MSLRIQNGERLTSRSRGANQRTALNPSPHVGILRRYWLPWRHSFGEPNWSAGDPLSAVGSSCQYPVCVWYSEELVLPQPASAPQTRREDKTKKKNGRSPKDTSRTRLGIRLLPLDLISTSFEVACGQQPIPAEGFARSERTESRSQPRCVRAPEPLSWGERERERGGGEVYVKLPRQRIFPPAVQPRPSTTRI